MFNMQLPNRLVVEQGTEQISSRAQRPERVSSNGTLAHLHPRMHAHTPPGAVLPVRRLVAASVGPDNLPATRRGLQRRGSMS